MCGFCNVCVCVCMCGCFGNMCTCIYCVFVLFHFSILILLKLLFNICDLCIFIATFMYSYCYVRFVLYILSSSCQPALFSYPDWGFYMLFLSCKANDRVQLAKAGHGLHSSQINCVVLCVNVYCTTATGCQPDGS